MKDERDARAVTEEGERNERREKEGGSRILLFMIYINKIKYYI